MATININDAEVTYVMRGGVGFHAETKYKTRDGEMIPEKWVIWTKEQVSTGDVVSISGLFSKKNEEFVNDKGEQIRYTAIHVNNAKITPSQTPAMNQMQQQATDSRLQNNATPAQNDGQIPF